MDDTKWPRPVDALWFKGKESTLDSVEWPTVIIVHDSGDVTLRFAHRESIEVSTLPNVLRSYRQPRSALVTHFGERACIALERSWNRCEWAQGFDSAIDDVWSISDEAPSRREAAAWVRKYVTAICKETDIAPFARGVMSLIVKAALANDTARLRRILAAADPDGNEALKP